MKSYKKATLVAKNARSGSYAAGCPAENRGIYTSGPNSCVNCDRAQ